ncbi:MamI family restriction endonuclease [Patescibacteria group bacterium]|nr:MamI family restriction endonuclease [Patescibacteria group bacterium]MDE1946968.1 MamI family restriction endonuclease [Patescibacteria group bacterium]MDE2011241.1 MamI family restriction endonuclease [Patescibacteria group bacterium]MDE2233405.1 MamI family restriction endonuclease [Patescibacteria group bacterium]
MTKIALKPLPPKEKEDVQIGLENLSVTERKNLIVKLLQEQILDQRLKLHFWKDLTKQAAQIDTGYIAQHLVSLITSLPGGGMRGKGDDLIDGDFQQKPSEIVDVEKPKRISEPFPNGESYVQTTARMKDFLQDLLKNYDGKRVMVIGHRATQYGLENLINGVPLEKLTTTHFKWQPGWKYELNSI